MFGSHAFLCLFIVLPCDGAADSLIRLKTTYEMDGAPLLIGVATLLKQLHPSVTRQVLAFLSQYVRLQIAASFARSVDCLYLLCPVTVAVAVAVAVSVSVAVAVAVAVAVCTCHGLVVCLSVSGVFGDLVELAVFMCLRYHHIIAL